MGPPHCYDISTALPFAAAQTESPMEGAMGGVRMGVLGGVAEERVEVLDGVKKPPYQAVVQRHRHLQTHTFGRWG